MVVHSDIFRSPFGLSFAPHRINVRMKVKNDLKALCPATLACGYRLNEKVGEVRDLHPRGWSRQRAISKTSELGWPVAQHLGRMRFFRELGKDPVVQSLQFQKGIHHRAGKARARMTARVCQKFVHQVSELLVAPEQLDFPAKFWIGVLNDLVVFLKQAHGTGRRNAKIEGLLEFTHAGLQIS